MNIEPTEQKQSISDDQELAKVLAGISTDEPAAVDASQQTTTPPSATVPASTDPNAPVQDAPAPVAPLPAAAGDESLDDIKKQALGELRPLVDKLQVEADEKFDIYLLLLRSTDDKTLIAPAHDAAKAITDESKKAQALLDIIKEIDFLSQPKDEAAK